MKNLLCLFATVALAAFLARQIVPAHRSRPEVAKVVTVAPRPAPATQSTPERKQTYLPGLRRYIDHDATVSPLRSIGGG